MAKQGDLVTVQNIKNPGITRKMTANSAKMNSRKWRIIDSAVQSEPTKKKDVEVVAAKAAPKLPESGNSFVNDDLAEVGQQVSEEFAEIVDDASDKTTLQKEYEEKTGKKPDGRWNEAKLKSKINEITNNNDEAA